jgi:aconitate hydratase
MAIAGDLSFNPLTDTLINEDGEEVMLRRQQRVAENGFDAEDKGFQEPAADGSNVEVTVSETSERLQLLAPFAPWDGKNIVVQIAYQSIRKMYYRSYLYGRTMVAFPWTFR